MSCSTQQLQPPHPSQRGGNNPLLQDLYKLAIPFGMLFAQQGVQTAMQKQNKPRAQGSSKSKPPSQRQPSKPKSARQNGGGCGCNSTKPYSAIGGSLQYALDSYFVGKHV